MSTDAYPNVADHHAGQHGSTDLSGWWLASDGNWYPPELASQPVATQDRPADAAPNGHRRASFMPVPMMVAGLIAVVLYAFTAFGVSKVGNQLHAAHWSPTLESQFIGSCSLSGSGLLDDGGPRLTGTNTASCSCFATALQEAGVSEADIATIGQTKSGSPAMEDTFEGAATSCGIGAV